jgi:hypothetical protein
VGLLSRGTPQLLLLGLLKCEMVVGCGIALLMLLLKGLAELLGQQPTTVIKPMRTRCLFFVRQLYQ